MPFSSPMVTRMLPMKPGGPFGVRSVVQAILLLPLRVEQVLVGLRTILSATILVLMPVAMVKTFTAVKRPFGSFKSSG